MSNSRRILGIHCMFHIGTSEYLALSACTEDCFNLKALISAELGTACPEDINSLFNNSWRTAILKIPSTYLNGDAQLGVFLEGFAFGGTNVLFDNIKLYSICSTSVEDCIIIPYNFGFDILTIEDNVKSDYDIDTNKDVLNTKEITCTNGSGYTSITRSRYCII